jgi:hypothetical protein
MCILGPFWPYETGKRSKINQTTHLDLYWALSSNFAFFIVFFVNGGYPPLNSDLLRTMPDKNVASRRRVALLRVASGFHGR